MINDHRSLLEKRFFFLIWNESLSQRALALRAYLPLIEGVHENIFAFISLLSVTTTERKFRLPSATFQTPTSLCVVTELRWRSYHYTPSFCLALQLMASRFVPRLYLIASSLLCCMKSSCEDIMIPLSPPPWQIYLCVSNLVWRWFLW